MTTKGSFTAERKFWDDEHFPYGFARSGDFTLEQASLLEAHGNAYLQLARGERTPADQLETDFVRFCRAEKEAENAHEKVWKRYSEKISNESKRYSLTRAEGRSAVGEPSESFDLDD